MIYVFMVDTGTMLTFDMNLALESVSVLKGAIHRNTRTPPDKQVLLASGGLALEEGQKVCFYPAGTDTNPIFLFSKSAIEGNAPPTPPTPPDLEGGELNLKAQVEGCLNMPATYNTVVSRTQLAQQFYECARDITRSCTHLVHDQHLQQQGWAAVVANLEDIVQAFKSRFESLKLSFSDYLNGREEKVTLLQCFEEDLKLLARIPVFPELLGRTEEEKRPEQEKEEEEEEEEEVKKKKKKEEEEEEEEEEKGKEKGQEEEEEARGIVGVRGRKKITPQISLLDWISAKDRQSDVRQVAELCFRGLSQISEGLLEGLSTEVVSVMREADRPEMKEVKGLEERLCGLEQLMHDAEFVVQEQHNFSQALLKNQDRAGKVNDPSIFPDLCTSHRKNLMHMLRNHQKLQDIKRRCIKAKEELSENLHVRLKWIMYIERKLYEADTRIAMHQENVRRLLGYLQVVEQIHRAPRVYAAAITEVARRQAFSKGFLKWASQLSSESGEVWRKEVEIRRLFYQEFSTHFLASLFPGMEDLPPDFATRLPERFDLALPKVTEENIEQLRLLLPELSNYLVVGNVVAVPPLLQHLYKGAKDEALGRESCEGTRAAVKNKLPQTIHELSKHIRLDQHSPGPQEEEEDEDEEEGGGRGGGGGGLFSPPLPPPLSGTGEREDIVSLQMELRAAKVEVDRLKSRLGQLGDLKIQVNALKTEVQSEGSSYMDYLSQVSSSVVSLLVQSQEQTDTELQRAHVQLADAHRRIKTYTAQLEDAHRELEVYMEQLQEKSGQIEEMRERGKEEKKRKEEEEEEEKQRRREEIQRLELDHEVEVATLRQTLATLQEAASGVEEEAEERIRARVQEERERIERALEATFIERERSSIERLERELRERLEREREVAREEERVRARAEIERERENRARERERELEEARREKEEEMERKLREEIEAERSKHRSELDSIRSRFKIMTTTTTASSPQSSSSPSSFPPSSSPTPTPFDALPPSSPSSRWEGIERLREEIEREKEREIRERLAHVREEERRKAEEEKQMEFTEELERIKRDKERVIEDLNIRIKLLMEEVDRRRGGGGMSLQEEVEEEELPAGGPGLMEENADLKAQVDSLTGQIRSLENELSRAKRFSFVSQPSTTTATTTAATTTTTTSATSSMTASELRDRQIVANDGVKLGACYPGDHVLIAYDTRHNHYRIILEQNVYLHFVHTDSYNALGISKDNPQQKLYCAAEVISKEFCQAKKDDNRFRVPKGTRFYRVVVKPWDGSSSSSSVSAATTTTTTTTATATTSTATT